MFEALIKSRTKKANTVSFKGRRVGIRLIKSDYKFIILRPC